MLVGEKKIMAKIHVNICVCFIQNQIDFLHFRHWSDLAEYSKSTKESRPENRHDALTHGVFFIRRKLVVKMGKINLEKNGNH